MKIVFIALTCALLIAATAFPQTNQASAEKQVIANERAALAAVVKHDLVAFKKCIVPEAFGLGNQGLLSIADWEKVVKTSTYQSLDIDNTQVHWVGSETAILTYHWTAKVTQDGKPKLDSGWTSSVYVLRNGKWLAIFNQDSK